MTDFTRTESVILICSVILFSVFIVYAIYRICLIYAYIICKNLDRGNDDPDPDPEGGTPRGRPANRVQSLLSRPGVRHIMASKAQTAVVEAEREQRSERRRRSEALEALERNRGRNSVVRFCPDTTTTTSPPPPYDQDAISLDSTGPPPSYHSRIDD